MDRIPFETTGRNEISLFGWGCRWNGLEVWWCIVWMRSGSAGSLRLSGALKVGAVAAGCCAAEPVSGRRGALCVRFGATVGCTECEVWCQVRCGFGLAGEAWSGLF